MKEWRKITLGEICEITKGKQLNKIELFKSGDYPCLNGGIEPSGYTDKWNTEANTITISEGGNSCGYINFMRTRFWSGGHCYSLLNIIEDINRDFFYQALKGNEKSIMGLRVGSGLPNIQRKALESFEINFPTSQLEQTAIAHILSTVDNAIERTEKLIAKYKRIKTGLMQDLLTKGIDENGNIRSEKTHKFKDSPLGRIPLEWEVKKLNSITLEIGDGIHATPKYVESSNIYFINGNNLSEGEIVINSSTNCVSQSEFEKYFIELDNNTILLSINGTIGNIAIYNNEKVILGKSVSYIKCKDNVLCNFLYYLLQSFRITHYFDNELTGSTIKNLSLVSIRNTPITMPEDPNEQEKIVDRLHLFDDFISNNYDILKKYQKLKYGLMQDLLTGKVRVPEELIEEINKKIVR